MLAAVCTAQTIQYPKFEATYQACGPYTYGGDEKLGVSNISANCDYNVTGERATEAGNYTALISSHCAGHYESLSSRWQIRRYHVGSYNVNWVIMPRNLTDGVTIEVKDQKWTGTDINVSDVYTVKYKNKDLQLNKDFTVTVTKLETPTTIVDEGRYAIIFTGIGNFTGTVTKTFDVKKDLTQAEDINGVHYDIPEQIFVQQSGQSFDFQCEVSDKVSHAKLFEGEDYELSFFTSENAQSADEIEETAVTLAATDQAKKYWVKFTGKAPKYDPQTYVVKPFYVVNEYQTSAPSPATLDPNVRGNLNGLAEVNIRITKAGYPVAADSPNGLIEFGEAKVAPKADGNPAIALTSTRCMILDTIKVATKVGDNVEYVNHNIVGIENNAFAGCDKLHWINSLIPGTYVPTSLDRTVIDTPFYGIPRQTLVYLYGYNIKGENYIYKITEEDFRSELFHIYEDVTGVQEKYSDQKTNN